MTLAIDAMAEVEQFSRDLRRACDPTSDSNLQNGDQTTNGSPKKRKRSRKAQPGKKFECKYEGCGKSYTRAEHLYRHQLNRRLALSSSLEEHCSDLPWPSVF